MLFKTLDEKTIEIENYHTSLLLRTISRLDGEKKINLDYQTLTIIKEWFDITKEDKITFQKSNTVKTFMNGVYEKKLLKNIFDASDYLCIESLLHCCGFYISTLCKNGTLSKNDIIGGKF